MGKKGNQLRTYGLQNSPVSGQLIERVAFAVFAASRDAVHARFLCQIVC